MESTTLDAMEQMCIKLEPCDNICVRRTAEAIGEMRVKAELWQDICAKTEPYDSARVKEEHPSADENVKNKPTYLKRHGVNATDTSQLYADHIVKDELVLGPEVMEKPMQEKELSGNPHNYKCGHCSFATARKSSLVCHMRTHRESQQSNENGLCGYTNQQKQKLKLHIQKCTGNKHYKCSKCSFAGASKGGLKRHELVHGEKRYKCNQCSYETAIKYSHVRHMNTHVKAYISSQCSYAAASIHDLINHKTIHVDRKYKCDYCGYATAKKSVLVCHIRKHTGETCNQCSYTTTTKSNLMHHIKLHGEKLYKCGQCSFATVHKQSLKVHNKLKHSNVKPYKCDQCDFATAFKNSFASHKLIHSDENLYKCVQCSYTSADRHNLRTHSMLHIGKKPYKCDQCSYATEGHNSLLDHIMTHTGEKRHNGEKRHKCDQCDYVAVHKSSLLRHNKRHIRKKGGKTTAETCPTATSGPLACQTCVKLELVPVSFEAPPDPQDEIAMKIKKEQLDFPTDFKDSFALHKSVHSGEKLYKCVQCNYASVEKRNLRTHTMLHTGKKPYKCDQCSYATEGRNSLLDHIMTHTGEKRHKCEQCDYVAVHKSSLLSHKKKHKGEKSSKTAAETCLTATSEPIADQTCVKVELVPVSFEAPPDSHDEITMKIKEEELDFATHFKDSFASDKRMHSSEKLYKCVQCSYASADRHNLRTHSMLHIGKKPYKCDQCSYATEGRNSLLDHIIMTHTLEKRHTGEKRHKCDQCDYVAVYKSSLLSHKKKHKGEKGGKPLQKPPLLPHQDHLLIKFV